MPPSFLPDPESLDKGRLRLSSLIFLARLPIPSVKNTACQPETELVPCFPKSSTLIGIVLLGAAIAGPTDALAQWIEPAERPLLVPSLVEEPPSMDGDVLGDPAWQGVEPAVDFWQNTPDEGRAATEKTEVYVVFTADTMYFGVVCYDRTPEDIIVASSRRDSSLEETDSFQLILDTYRDQKTGFVFGTNPVGIQYDGQVTQEGEGGGFRTAGGFNINWDGDWQVEAAISDIGWSAELAIPFRTLRYPRDRSQTWGVNFQRNLRRRNEQAYWSPLPRQYNIYRLSMAGGMENFEVPRQNNLKVLPYVLAEGTREGVEEAPTETDGNVGIDVKYSLTPSMTLDGTINTDFAQVEADELQINLDRFNLFFPENRPFFLENAGYFTVGVPQEVELFYSRRIGLGPEGEIVPIDWGLRMSGKARDRYNIGLLYMQTDDVTDVTPENQFGVVRLNRDLPNRSGIGGILIHRRGDGGSSGEEDYNWTYGLDGRWGVGQNGLVDGYVAKTDTPGLEGDDYSFRLGGAYDSEKWSLSASYTEVADNFNPEVGYLTRRGYRKPEGFLMRRIRPRDLWGLLELRPHVSYRGYWNYDGFQETGFLHIDNHWEWRNGYEVHTGINFTREGLLEPFELVEDVTIPPGTYDNTEAQIVFYTNQGAPVAFSARVMAGGFFNGDRLSLSPTFRFRLGDTFNTEIGWQYNDIDLETGTFRTNLGLLRVSYSFTQKIFVQGLLQYNDRDDIWATNLRFGWLTRATAGFYLVYNEIRDIEGAGTGIPGRSLTLKYSHLFDILH